MSKFTVTEEDVRALSQKVFKFEPEAVEVTEEIVSVDFPDYITKDAALILFYSGLGVLWDYDNFTMTEEFEFIRAESRLIIKRNI